MGENTTRYKSNVGRRSCLVILMCNTFRSYFLVFAYDPTNKSGPLIGMVRRILD